MQLRFDKFPLELNKIDHSSMTCNVKGPQSNQLGNNIARIHSMNTQF